MVKITLDDGSTVEVSEEVAEIHKNIEKKIEESRKNHKKMLESLTPEHRKQWLRAGRTMKLEEEGEEAFEKNLSSEMKKLRKALLKIGSFFPKLRRLERSVSRSRGGKAWSVIKGERKPRSKIEEKTVNNYRTRREELINKAKKEYKKIKKYSRKEYEKVLLMDEFFHVFTMLNTIDEKFQKESEKEEKKGEEKRIKLKRKLTKEEKELREQLLKLERILPRTKILKNLPRKKILKIKKHKIKKAKKTYNKIKKYSRKEYEKVLLSDERKRIFTIIKIIDPEKL